MTHKEGTPVWKYIFRTFLAFTGLVMLAELVIYFAAPVYDFPSPQPFSGNRFYNPYDGMDSHEWKKANFHFHTRVWSGLTSGRKNSHESVYKAYKALGYDIPGISNYQQIDREFMDSAFYIPAYEHGFGIRKKHQLLIGAKKVLWFDYSLIQNLDHKQHILNLLRPDNEIVSIAHPDWENGYSLKDMQYLSGYDLIEVLDNNWRSLPQWDAALSSGHPVFIVADDDAHDINNPYQIGRCCTFINCSSLKSGEIVRSLKEGKSFGADIYMSEAETLSEKDLIATKIPVVESVRMNHDTLFVEVSERAFRIRFIGQNGTIKKTNYSIRGSWYKFTPEDTYIRTEITFYKYFPGGHKLPGTRFYLNPVFRYNGDRPSNDLRAEINLPRTWIFRILSFGGLIGLIAFIVYFRRNKAAFQSLKR